VWFGSSLELLDELRRLNEETYRISSDRKFEDADEGNRFDKSARLGLEMFLRLAQLSVEHQLPMKLDY
jgi:hypothetical protein